MSDSIATDNTTAVIGLGATGWSCVRYLHARGQRFAVFDSGISDVEAERFTQRYPGVPIFTGEFETARLASYRRLLVSPGISLQVPAIRAVLDSGAELISDIDLLLHEISAPIVAITGSNGKTTVTTLLGLMAEAAGRVPAVGGNIGKPVLDFVTENQSQAAYDLYVLELSSFQLERCGVLAAQAATVLNLSADHLDRHPSLQNYQQAKQKIYRGCHWAVFNREDKLTSPLLGAGQQGISFGAGQPDLGQFGLLIEDGQCWLMHGNERLLNAAQMKMRGRHNQLNALAALALGQCAGLDREAMLAVLQSFPGLPHRCQWLGEAAGVQFYNDSKGTNVGATLAALSGLSRDGGDIVLIAGGVGKGADFQELARGRDALKGVVVFGEAAAPIASVFAGSVDCREVTDLAAALRAAIEISDRGDIVLLSPACASFDMYPNYVARGEHFEQLVAAVPGLVRA